MQTIEIIIPQSTRPVIAAKLAEAQMRKAITLLGGRPVSFVPVLDKISDRDVVRLFDEELGSQHSPSSSQLYCAHVLARQQGHLWATNLTMDLFMAFDEALTSPEWTGGITLGIIHALACGLRKEGIKAPECDKHHRLTYRTNKARLSWSIETGGVVILRVYRSVGHEGSIPVLEAKVWLCLSESKEPLISSDSPHFCRINRAPTATVELRHLKAITGPLQALMLKDTSLPPISEQSLIDVLYRHLSTDEIEAVEAELASTHLS